MNTNATALSPAGFRWNTVLHATLLPIILVAVWQVWAMTLPEN